MQETLEANSPMLVASHLRKLYPTPGEDLVVLDDVSLELAAGQNAAIVGPSGSGKSTLLQILGALDPPTAGQLTVGGIDPYSLTEKEQARFRNDKVGFVFQDHHLLPQLNVLENTLIPTLAQGHPDQSTRQRATELLERVGLGNRWNHLPSQLSGGERGRVAVARALIRKPLLVLADEPTGNLDADNADKISDILLELPREENAMLIVVTHSMQLAKRMQRCLELRRGQLVSFAS
jgi:lipoprotein-releasing system ATP-binding protein